jgi:hypothetical protein
MERKGKHSNKKPSVPPSQGNHGAGHETPDLSILYLRGPIIEDNSRLVRDADNLIFHCVCKLNPHQFYAQFETKEAASKLRVMLETPTNDNKLCIRYVGPLKSCPRCIKLTRRSSSSSRPVQCVCSWRY